MSFIRLINGQAPSESAAIPVWSLWFNPNGVLEVHRDGRFVPLNDCWGDLAESIRGSGVTDLFCHAHGINIGFNTTISGFVTGYYGMLAGETLPGGHKVGVIELAWPSEQSSWQKVSQLVELVGIDGGFSAIEEVARKIGRERLAPFLERLKGPRIHLVAHSLGTRLVSTALQHLPGGAVTSVFLIQGALQADAFAQELQGADRAVQGHIAATHSRADDMLKLFTARAHKTPIGWDGFEGVASQRVDVRSWSSLPAHKFLDIDCNDLIGDHDGYVRLGVLRAHLAVAQIQAPDGHEGLGFELHRTREEAERRTRDAKSAHGSGVSNLGILWNNSREPLTRLMSDSWCGGFRPEPPRVIPPGYFASFFHHHPNGSTDGSWGSFVYRVGSTGQDLHCSFRAAYTIGFKRNKVHAELNVLGHYGDGPRSNHRDYIFETLLTDSGYTHSTTRDGIGVDCSIEQGDSPWTRFEVKHR
jgi:pimeloyl-ACP methyl ester carboxylesterase